MKFFPREDILAMWLDLCSPPAQPGQRQSSRFVQCTRKDGGRTSKWTAGLHVDVIYWSTHTWSQNSLKIHYHFCETCIVKCYKKLLFGIPTLTFIKIKSLGWFCNRKLTWKKTLVNSEVGIPMEAKWENPMKALPSLNAKAYPTKKNASPPEICV